MRGALRYLVTGVPRNEAAANVDGALDNPGFPAEPDFYDAWYAQGIPYFDGLEDPDAQTGFIEPTANPTLPFPDEGARMPVGAYDGAYGTRGPVVQIGHEVSGGPYGDQAIGARMVFQPYIPSRYDPNGVHDSNGYADQVAAAIAAGAIVTPVEADYLPGLLTSI